MKTVRLAGFLVLLMAGQPSFLMAQATDASAPLASPGTTPTVFDQPALVQTYQQTITPEDLAAHLYFFASDFFEGRETTARGQKMAAHYLASQYRKMGLVPKGTAGSTDARAPDSYFQPFEVYGRRMREARLQATIDGAAGETHVFSPEQWSDHAFLVFGNTAEVNADVVFGGYGIPDDELGYNDYAAMQAAGIDHRGRWLMLLRDEPLAEAEKSLFTTSDGGPSRWTTDNTAKFRPLFNYGLPAGILIVGE